MVLGVIAKVKTNTRPSIAVLIKIRMFFKFY